MISKNVYVETLQLDCSEIYFKYFVATNLVINLGFLHQRIQHIEHTVNIPNLKDKILLKTRKNYMTEWQSGIIIVLSSPLWRKSFSIFKAPPILINQLIKTMTNCQTWLVITSLIWAPIGHCMIMLVCWTVYTLCLWNWTICIMCMHSSCILLILLI